MTYVLCSSMQFNAVQCSLMQGRLGISIARHRVISGSPPRVQPSG